MTMWGRLTSSVNKPMVSNAAYSNAPVAAIRLGLPGPRTTKVALPTHKAGNRYTVYVIVINRTITQGKNEPQSSQSNPEE
jgi:hypothetical protein